MRTPMPTRSLTVRLPEKLYSAATEAARKRAVSLNTFVQHSLSTTLLNDEERGRYEAYSLLGEEKEDSDVEYAIHAQAEVMLSE